MPKLSGKLRETPNGLLNYEIDGNFILLFPLATMIQKKFGLEAGRFPAFGLDQVLVELIYKDLPIVVGWDIWSDLSVMAMEKGANEKVKEIAEYLDGILDELETLEEKLLAEQKERKKE